MGYVFKLLNIVTFENGKIVQEHEFDGDTHMQFMIGGDNFECQELSEESSLYDKYLETVNRILGQGAESFLDLRDNRFDFSLKGKQYTLEDAINMALAKAADNKQQVKIKDDGLNKKSAEELVDEIKYKISHRTMQTSNTSMAFLIKDEVLPEMVWVHLIKCLILMEMEI